MKVWIDDIRPMPEGYDIWAKSVDEAKALIIASEKCIERCMEKGHEAFIKRNYALRSSLYQRANDEDITLIDIDCDVRGRIEFLNWLETTKRNYPICIHIPMRRGKMKIWVDDVRPAPEGYRWVTNVDEAKITIGQHYHPIQKNFPSIEVLDLDHDAGQWNYLGDYIDILTWLERKQEENGWKINFPIHIHSMNPVGVQNMRAIIKRNNWKEV